MARRIESADGLNAPSDSVLKTVARINRWATKPEQCEVCRTAKAAMLNGGRPLCKRCGSSHRHGTPIRRPMTTREAMARIRQQLIERTL